MRNGTKHKMMPLLSPFNDICAVTFVLPDEMADVSIAGLQWFVLTLPLNHTGSHRPIDSHSIPHLYPEKKLRIWNKNYTACCYPTNYRKKKVNAYELQGKQLFVSDFLAIFVVS